jgi:uncharacterized protein (DUF362 family)
MVSRVALVRTEEGVQDAYQRALGLIGGIDDLDSRGRDVTVKVGIYDARNLNHPSPQIVGTVASFFVRPHRVFLAESDNHMGKALDRLQAWKEVFSERVVPFDLSHDRDKREGLVCGEKIWFSHVLFKPNVLVSLHALRQSEMGCVLKNLLGLIPDTRKDRFHSSLGEALLDINRAVGGVDLAVIDGTYLFAGKWKEGEPLQRIRKDLLVVGRDPVAVEVVGCMLAEVDPSSVASIAMAKERGLGETDPNRIEILGDSSRVKNSG